MPSPPLLDRRGYSDMNPTAPDISAAALGRALRDARDRTLELVADLDGERMIGPRLAIVNPPLWEIGHIAWFQEFWALRHLRGEKPLAEGGDALYDSAKVAHAARWELPLPSRERTLAYMDAVWSRVIESLGDRALSPAELYFHHLVLFHEDMHGEAILFTRQTLGYPAPKLSPGETAGAESPAAPRGDAEIPGGPFLLGAPRDSLFLFDNEKWAHPVEIAPFRISRAAVTNGEFAAFVDAGSYRKREFWTEEGWRWLQTGGSPALDGSFSKFFHQEQRYGETAPQNIDHPVYWKKESGGWLRRDFDASVPLGENLPVTHVNWYEASAYAKWARRRLPTEAEWEMAAAAEPEKDGRGIGPRPRKFPWGDEPPAPGRANLDGRALGPVAAGALPRGDSAFGCRQMIGNAWEWTASDFSPYPGFAADPYKEYSEPWFGTHKVLRGGCWATRARLIHNTWRNFYTPDRRDVCAGFRTCAP